MTSGVIRPCTPRTAHWHLSGVIRPCAPRTTHWHLRPLERAVPPGVCWSCPRAIGRHSPMHAPDRPLRSERRMQAPTYTAAYAGGAPGPSGVIRPCTPEVPVPPGHRASFAHARPGPPGRVRRPDNAQPKPSKCWCAHPHIARGPRPLPFAPA